MAISRIGSWVSVYGGASGGASQWNGGTTGTLPLGTTPAADDLVLVLIYNRTQNNGNGANTTIGSGFAWTGSTGLGTYALTHIIGHGLSSNHGSIEALYWRADGSSNPTFIANPIATGNNTAVMAAGVFRGVDWSTGPVDMIGPLTNNTIDRPPVGATAGSAPNADWTGKTFTTVNGGLCFAVVGNAGFSTGGWTANPGSTNTQAWAIDGSFGGNNGVNGGAGLIIQSVALGGGTATGTMTIRSATTATLGRAVTFALRAAAGGTLVTLPTPPHITFTADPLVVQPVTILMPTPYIHFAAGTLTVSKHVETGASVTFGGLTATAAGASSAGGTQAISNFGGLTAIATGQHGTGWTSGAAASFGGLTARVSPGSSGGGSGSGGQAGITMGHGGIRAN